MLLIHKECLVYLFNDTLIGGVYHFEQEWIPQPTQTIENRLLAMTLFEDKKRFLLFKAGHLLQFLVCVIALQKVFYQRYQHSMIQYHTNNTLPQFGQLLL